ncbi:hypothetical protein, partial [Photobacterium leiognathi]|uniref:hypothetical protein n=1 Tax=Photobacterium leiognathi TaxID=553611 RepID=UPI002980B763
MPAQPFRQYNEASSEMTGLRCIWNLSSCWNDIDAPDTRSIVPLGCQLSGVPAQPFRQYNEASSEMTGLRCIWNLS